MPLIFDDTVSFAVPGSGLPSGFAFFGGGGSATIRAGTDGGAFSVHNWLEFATGQFLQCGLNTGHLVDSVTIWFLWKSEGFAQSGPIMQIWGYPSAIIDPSGKPFPTVILQVEKDNTFSILVAGSPNVLLFNTGGLGGTISPFWVQPEVWYFVEFSVHLTYVGGTSGMFAPRCTLIVDGQVLCADRPGTSNFYSDQSFIGASGPPTPAPGDPGCNFFTFTQPNGSGDIGLGDVTAAEGFVTTPTLNGSIWNFFIDNPGLGYGPLSPTIAVVDALGNTSAMFEAVLAAPPGGTGPVGSLTVLSLGDGYGTANEPINLVATPFGSPNGSGFMGHAIPMPVASQRVPQAVAEYSWTKNPFIRIPQAVIERGWRSPNVGIRIAQAVIELPASGIKPVLGDRWIVKEC